MQAIKQKKLTELSYSTFEFIKLPSISASLCPDTSVALQKTSQFVAAQI